MSTTCDSGLAAELVAWLDATPRPTGKALYDLLATHGKTPPQWLLELIPNADDVPSKSTRAIAISRALQERRQ